MTVPKRFTFVASIGEGYAAKVERYHDNRLGSDVAIKRLRDAHRGDNEFVQRFRKEIEFLTELEDVDGVITLLDVIESTDEMAYVMPLGSCNLYKYIKTRNNKLDLRQRASLFDQVIPPVRDAHDRGVLHRDICPHNVVVFEDENQTRLRVCDFGLGKSAEEMTVFTKSNEAGFGHVFYVAPEQRASLKSASVQSDIHSMGRLLNFVITGKDPDRHYQCDFSFVINTAIETDPGRRYQSMHEFEAAYESLKDLLFGASVEGSFDLALVQVDDTVDWLAFHSAAVTPRYSGHVYYGYLERVIEYLTHGDNLESYYAAVGSNIRQFVDTLLDKMQECIGTVGWPFSATTDFARFLERLLRLCDDEESRVLCFCRLWDIAYEGNQFGAQDVVYRVLSEGLPEAIHTSIAAHIHQSKVWAKTDRLLSLNIPSVIRRALSQLSN